MTSSSKPRFGVMLVNLGTPEAPTPDAVRRYLGEFLWDQRVVDVSRPLWWLILNGIILRIRPQRVAKAYASVWTDQGSPLMKVSQAQAIELKQRLEDMLGTSVPVELAMTYGVPTMESAGQAFRQAGVERIIVLPLYPQFSATTTGAVFDRLAKALKPCPSLPELHFIRDYHQNSGYIEALANSVREYQAAHGMPDRLLMSFHGIPQRYARQGDPYPQQCEATAQALAEALGLEADQWALTFQSRFGREPWLQPYTDKTLAEWGRSGLERVAVICPGFAADCLETLEEIALQNAEIFTEAGGGTLDYIPALNDRVDHIQMLADLVVSQTQGWS